MNNKSAVPGIEECYEIMKQHEMLENIFNHSVQVMNVALAIVDSLVEKYIVSIDRDLVAAAALLHDIAKTRTIRTGEYRHDLIGGDMLRGMGLDDIAVIVESHVVFEDFSEEGPLEEREIVYYADKRVMHDRIVSLDERIDDLVIRYGKTEKIAWMIKENKKFITALGNKIERFTRGGIESAISGL